MLLCVICHESVFTRRQSTIKVLLKYKLEFHILVSANLEVHLMGFLNEDRKILTAFESFAAYDEFE